MFCTRIVFLVIFFILKIRFSAFQVAPEQCREGQPGFPEASLRPKMCSKENLALKS
jgi:hypothetical protein